MLWRQILSLTRWLSTRQQVAWRASTRTDARAVKDSSSCLPTDQHTTASNPLPPSVVNIKPYFCWERFPTKSPTGTWVFVHLFSSHAGVCDLVTTGRPIRAQTLAVVSHSTTFQRGNIRETRRRDKTERPFYRHRIPNAISGHRIIPSSSEENTSSYFSH